jgi:enoyl-CoA hydratase/carnithine racemase
LGLESAAYSALQAGPEFGSWWQRTTNDEIEELGPVVGCDRDGDTLTITLDRPRRHNAINAQLRDELYAALSIAVADDSIRSIVLDGSGPSFCSGGDLAEFGTRPDPATGHITRLARSPGRLIHQLRDRTTVNVHGSTLGGGLEMAAFAGQVTAHPDTMLGLPEVGLGLIPGAGGTISVTSRIGRQRTAALALTGRTIDARTALAWGLVDDVINSR